MSDDTQKSLVVPEEQGIIAQGEELRLALHGTHAEIHAYLDEQRRLHGRSAELHSADIITSERKTREVNQLAAGHQVVNNSDPGGPGRIDEHVAVLREMASYVSSVASPDDGQPVLAQHDRWLVEYDVTLKPPAVRITTAAMLREVLSRQLDYLHKPDQWPFFYRNADLKYTDHIPGTGPQRRMGFSPSPDGTIYYQGKKATAAQLKQLADMFWNEPIPGNVVSIPDVDPCRMDRISEEAFQQALSARRWPGVQDIADFADHALESAPRSLAERMAGLAPWRGSKADLARDLGWRESIMRLNAELPSAAAELATLGWVFAATGAKTGPTRAREFVIMELRGPAENPAAIPGKFQKGPREAPKAPKAPKAALTRHYG
jgi:hypothetical protein